MKAIRGWLARITMTGILMVVAGGMSGGAWAQPPDPQSPDAQREELLRRASGLARTLDQSTTPSQAREPGAPPAPREPRPEDSPRLAPREDPAPPPARPGRPAARQLAPEVLVDARDRPSTGAVAATPPQKPASLPGQVFPLAGPIKAELYVPPGWKESGGALDLLVHFHGAPWVVEQALEEAKLRVPLLAVNPGGLGGRYSALFKDPEAFDGLLDQALDLLRRNNLAGSEAQWKRLFLSSFSAGYGAIRELLYSAQYFNRVEGIALADGLHTSFDDATTSTRQVNAAQMRPFVEFARLAVEGKKTLVLSRSSILPENYCGTPETAAYLVRAVGGREEKVQPPVSVERGMQLIARYEKGNLRVWGYAGENASNHMDHFYAIGALLKELPLARAK